MFDSVWWCDRVGVISGALLYIRDDFKSVDKKTILQVSIYKFRFSSETLTFNLDKNTQHSVVDIVRSKTF